MKRILILIAILLALPLLALAQNPKQTSSDAAAEQELKNLVRAWDDAVVKGDTATLDRILAAEFSFVGGVDKSRFLAVMGSKSPDTFVESAVSTEVQVQVYGDTAVLTGLDTMSGKNKGQPYTEKWLYMDVWVKRDGRWQCVKTYSALAGK